MPELNHDYYVLRAQTARELAGKATDPAIRAIHERMASDYAELAKLTGPLPLKIAT